MADMAKRQTLDASLTFRLLKSEKEDADKLRHPTESLGDLARIALQREIERRKRQAKKDSKNR